MVCCVATTSDNKYIISGSMDKTIRIWDFLDKISKNTYSNWYPFKKRKIIFYQDILAQFWA